MYTKIRLLFKRYRFSGVFELVLYKFLKLIRIRLLRIYLLKIDASSYIVPSKKVDYIPLSFDDFLKYTDSDKEWFRETKLQKIKNNLSNGCLAYGLIKDNTIISYGCINPNYTQKKGEHINKSCFLFDDYTHPKYRGKGLHGLCLDYRISYLILHGYESVYIEVHAYNKASIKGIISSGFKPYTLTYKYKIGSGPIHFKNIRLKNPYKLI